MVNGTVLSTEETRDGWILISYGIQVSCMQNQAACRYMSHWISHPSRVQHIAA